MITIMCNALEQEQLIEIISENPELILCTNDKIKCNSHCRDCIEKHINWIVKQGE